MRKVVMIALALAVAISFSACKVKRACERACQCKFVPAEDPDDPDRPLTADEWQECVDQCIEDMDSESDACAAEFHTWARCMDTNVCDPLDCELEAIKMDQKCTDFSWDQFASMKNRPCDRLCECKLGNDYTLTQWWNCVDPCYTAWRDTPPAVSPTATDTAQADPDAGISDAGAPPVSGTSTPGCQENFNTYTKCLSSSGCSFNSCEMQPDAPASNCDALMNVINTP